jgi:hypothetical protein
MEAALYPKLGVGGVQKLAFSHCRDMWPLSVDLVGQARTGKAARQLRSARTEQWKGRDSPGLPSMPLQRLISEPLMNRIDRAVKGANAKTPGLISFLSPGVGLADSLLSCRQVVAEFMMESVKVLEDMARLVVRG